MTHALNAAYESGSHPHVPAGSSTGGQFAPTGGNDKKAPAKTSPKGHPTPKRPSRHAQHDDGTLSYDAKTNRGAGYGSKDGDPRVHKLQEALNRLGLKDSAGKPLKLDGKLGPRTTAAIRKAQHRLGLPVDGKVTPALLAKITSAKTLTRAPAKKATKAAADEPYGDVGYADPGYQADGKKRYPLDSEEHCRAAWSYINMPDNASKYSAEQLAGIKAKIKAAGRKYGIDFADEVKASASALRDVELARPGIWKLSTGPTEFTDQMLRDAADFFAASGGQAVPVKLGHVDDRFDGEPTFGSVTNVRYTEDDRGPVLLGDIVDMPQWLGAAAPKRWPNRSIEGWQNFEYDGREYSLVLSGLAFLGVTPPGVRNIKSLADLQVALAASSATRLVAAAPPDDQAAPPQTAAPPAEVPITEGAGMTLANYREALAGLPDDASEDDVKAALEAAGFAMQSPPPPETAGAPEAIPVAAAGTIVLASSVWEETQKTIKSLTDHVAKTKRNERDEIIAKAVVAGKFTPAQKPHFSRLWDADPDGTRTLIDTLTPNSQLAVMASGYAGEGEEADTEYAALFGSSNTKVG